MIDRARNLDPRPRFRLVFSDLVALLLVGAVAVVALISVAAGLSTDSNLLVPQG